MNPPTLHFGVLLSNAVHKSAFINALLLGKSEGPLSVLNHKKGILFSDLTIDQVIEKEHRHECIEISKSQNRPLHTFSSGERRKLLLAYCLAQKPDYIIFDNPFDHLDQASRKELAQELTALSASVSMVQLANQPGHFLPFMKLIGYIKDNSFCISSPPNTLANPTKTQDTISFPDSLLQFDQSYKYIVKFNKVSIAYADKPVVNQINWEVKQGEFWQLIGPNGSGKSTLLSLITGENPKAYGQDLIIFDRKKGSGESIWDIKKNIGQFSTHLAELFQRIHTVEQMVLSGFFDSVGLYRKPSRLQEQKAQQWLSIIKMSHLKSTYFTRLPLGQQRLVLIVRALIKQPPLLILDEPFEGLDTENTALVASLINTVVEKTDITVIYVSHTIEKSLVPSHIYELTPHREGSIGHIKHSFN